VRFLLFQTPDKARYSGTVRISLKDQKNQVLWNSKNLTKTPDKNRYSGTVRISLKHQKKPDTLEK
jgi:hypothetical protein